MERDTEIATARHPRSRLPGAALRAAADLFLPPQCLACATPVADHDALCVACWIALDPIVPPLCDRLGTPLPHGVGDDLLSTEAIASPPPFARLRAVSSYSDVAARLVHALKYGDRLEVARAMGGWMARAGQDLLADADVIVPVPLHARRLWQRRYNQSALLAQNLARLTGMPWDSARLRRVRATRSQVGLTASQRATNMRGAFAVAPRASVDGQRVLLVDDVYTTGTTVRAATAVLARAGASAVDVLVFARVVHDRA